MTAFEKLFPILVLLLTLAAAAVLFFALRIERRLAARKRVNLSNYREKNYLFYITRDFPVAVSAAAASLFALVMAILALCNPVLRLYAVVLVLLVAVNGASAYFALTRTKFTRDLRIFDAYYVKVADMLGGKARTEMDLDVCTRRVGELRTKLDTSIGDFNRNLTEPISGDFLPTLFAPLDEMIASFRVEIERFSVEIEADFNRALAEFLETEQEPTLRVVPMRSFDELTVDDLLAEVKTSYAARVTELVIAQVTHGSVPNAAALGNIMKLFHSLGIRVDNETLARFLRAAAVYDDRAALATLLYANKQIPVATVREVLIPEEMEWAFAPGMAAAFNARELAAVLSDLLTADRATMCYVLLSQFGAAQRGILEEALAAAKSAGVKNAAVRQAKAFRLILGTEYAVGNSGSIHENVALMLHEHAEQIGLPTATRERLAEIVREESYMQCAEELASLYGKVAARLSPLCESATRVLLQYVMDATKGEELLDERRLVALLGEYRFTQSAGELAVLRALVAGLLLCTSQDDEVKSAVTSELSALPTAANAKGDAATQGRGELAYLIEHEGAALRAVLYRSERERCTLDRVIQICNGEE